MKTIHGGKVKNDRVDSRKIADLLAHIQNTNLEH